MEYIIVGIIGGLVIVYLIVIMLNPDIFDN